jgi:hypothetical protein
MGCVFEDFNKDDASVTIVTMSQGCGNIFGWLQAGILRRWDIS